MLDAQTFDGRALGAEFDRLKPPIADFTIFGGMMLNRFDIGHFMSMTRKPSSALRGGCSSPSSTGASRSSPAPRWSALRSKTVALAL